MLARTPSGEGLKAELRLPHTGIACAGPEPGLGACQLSLPAPERWELALSS